LNKILLSLGIVPSLCNFDVLWKLRETDAWLPLPEKKEYKLNSACSMHGKDEKCIKEIESEQKGREHLGYVGVGGRIILKGFLRK
jgi:hypothetical protein